MEKEDSFMKSFKYYKSNNPKPSLEKVITIDNFQHLENVIITVPAKKVNEDLRTELLGLHSPLKWKTYSFRHHPGLYLIRNPFTSLGQRYWVWKCVEEYPKRPNNTNVRLNEEYTEWQQQFLNKLRWTTLGYQHNWDTKVYTEDNRTAFPDDLAELSDIVAKYLGYVNFKAEAAIVNYYNMKSTLSGHTDHSEVNLEAPLFSFSFGQSAIFLIGGPDKSTPPSAILLQSGDIIMMSKEARLCYHAVPKILPSPTSPWDDEIREINLNDVSILKYIKNPKQMMLNINRLLDKEWLSLHKYIKESRINMNVRQVLNERQCNLNPVAI